MAIQTYLKIAT